MYFIQKNITRFNNIGHTYFLNPNQLNKLKGKLPKNTYNIYKPYFDSEKNIVYKNYKPNVLLYEIKTKQKLRHQDIMGTMYSLNIADDLFGDILIINNRYYIYILDIVRNYFESNLVKIKNTNVELEEIDINILEVYHRNYEKIEIIVSSNRIDTIISTIIHTSRNNIDNYIKNKDIMVNYEYLKKSDYKLKENDVFSVKGIGKYKYMGLIKKTKSNNCIVSIYKYC